MSTTRANEVLRLTRRYRFSASHRLHADALSEAENAAAYGKCNHPFGHGHDYVLDVTVRGAVDARTGRVVDLEQLDGLVQDCVLRDFEHRYLNEETAEFRELVPTSENVARVIAARLTAHWDARMSGGARLDIVRLEETKRNRFELRS
jgi:6-pyruvoyltetrahydropterin/6-carboxytetrahydropterin synthase